MGMGIGINDQHTDHGDIKGYQEAIACGVWFTSTGTVMPKMLKFQDDKGIIRMISNIHVISFERRNYCGIPTLEYNCDTMLEGRRYCFHLLFYTEKQEWKILWKNARKEEKPCVDATI